MAEIAACRLKADRLVSATCRHSTASKTSRPARARLCSHLKLVKCCHELDGRALFIIPEPVKGCAIEADRSVGYELIIEIYPPSVAVAYAVASSMMQNRPTPLRLW